LKLDWKAIVGIVISGGLLWWLFRDQDPAALWQQIKSADPWLFLGAVAIATSSYAIRAIRWGILLAPVAPNTSLYNRWATTLIGFMANNVLPARIGEVVRAYAVSRVEPVGISTAFGSLVVARFLDGVALAVTLIFALSSPTFPRDATVLGQPIGGFVQGVLLVLATILVVLVGLLAWPKVIVRIATRASGLMPGHLGPKLVQAVESFLEGLTVLRTPKLLALAVLWSLVHWFYYGVAFMLALRAFGMDLDFAAGLFTQAMVAAGVSVPSAPGFFGTWHAAAQIALVGPYNVPETQAIAFATGFHMGGFLPITLLGLYYAWRLGISVTTVDRTEPAAPADAQDAGATR
jgi:uncharacterized protein (TIRG00374 family)